MGTTGNSSWQGIIGAVQTPLGFFVLALLLGGETVLGIAAGLTTGSDRTYLIIGMIALIFFLVGLVAVMAFYRPDSLYGRERTARGSTDQSLGFSEIPTREQYIQSIVSSIATARSRVRLYANKLHTSLEKEDARKVNDALRDARENQILVEVLVARGVDRLPGAYELAKRHSIEVRMTPELQYPDLRFLGVDGETLVVGVADPTSGQPYVSSNSWAKIRSKGFGEMLDKEFDKAWDHAQKFDEYSVEKIREARQMHHDSKKVSEVLGLPFEYISEIS